MKSFVVVCVAAVVAAGVTGCRWCYDPQQNNPSCLEESHVLITTNKPDTVSMVTPNIGISREVFRPVFRAGTARLTVMGSGFNREEASMDAIAKFLEKANCDYIVSVSTVAVKTIHPTPWWHFICCHSFTPWWHVTCNHSNYSVRLSGIPVYMDKLSCEQLAADKVEAYDANTGLFIPSRGYDSTPAKATRLIPPMSPADAEKPHVVTGVAPKAPEAKVEQSSSFFSSLFGWL